MITANPIYGTAYKAQSVQVKVEIMADQEEEEGPSSPSFARPSIPRPYARQTTVCPVLRVSLCPSSVRPTTQLPSARSPNRRPTDPSSLLTLVRAPLRPVCRVAQEEEEGGPGSGSSRRGRGRGGRGGLGVRGGGSRRRRGGGIRIEQEGGPYDQPTVLHASLCPSSVRKPLRSVLPPSLIRTPDRPVHSFSSVLSSTRSRCGGGLRPPPSPRRRGGEWRPQWGPASPPRRPRAAEGTRWWWMASSVLSSSRWCVCV
ncbi:hypothetical protein BXZ70DRAFT_557239 [Cristinia sonorae]|uniref:Uncharacterized protein n=1 Tax=Cristinia sonorae TaxID=1940300 RepID=A0A8K0UGH4_9AGAR|nr:hypothetical protein BXZ70DRAFT_557239 [Cristinia sonorae]